MCVCVRVCVPFVKQEGLRGHGGFQAAAPLPQFTLVAVQGHLFQGGGGGQRGGNLGLGARSRVNRSCLSQVVTGAAGAVFDELHVVDRVRGLDVVYGFGRRNGSELSVVKLL